MADDLPDAPWATGEALPDAPWGATPPAAKQPVSPMAKALEPITSYPETYSTMNKEAREQMSHGVDQLSSPSGAWDVAKGVGNVGLGALNYVTSPISAGLRTVVGKPVEENTGIPKEYSEFAASLAIPGMGLKSAAPILGEAKAIAPTREALETAADQGFKAAKTSGAVVPAEHITGLAQQARASLENEGFRDYLAPKTFSVLKELETPAEGAGANISDLHGMRRVLSKASMSTDPTEREAAGRVISSLDSYLSNVSPELKDAIKNYGALKRSERVEEAVSKADLSAAAANSGQNIDNATRQKFKSILLSPKARRGYSEGELGQMEKIVRGSYTGDAMRFLGNLLGGGGGLGSAVTAGIGAFAAGPLGAATPLVGYAAKKAGNLSTSKQVEALDEMIRMRSPLADKGNEIATARDMARKWAKAYAASQASPNAGTAKLLNTTSRGLALVLNRNLGMDAQKTFQSLQGLAPSAADQQPQQ